MRVGGGGLGDEGEAGCVLDAAEASMSAVVYGRRLGQLEVVLPRLGCGGRGPNLGAVVIAGAGIVREGVGIARPLALAVVAVVARATARAANLVGKYGSGERGRVEHTVLVEAFRYRRSGRHGLVAGTGALPFEFNVYPRLQVVERKVLPTVLDLDIGESQTVLQCARHLRTETGVRRLEHRGVEEKATFETWALRRTFVATSAGWSLRSMLAMVSVLVGTCWRVKREVEAVLQVFQPGLQVWRSHQLKWQRNVDSAAKG